MANEEIESKVRVGPQVAIIFPELDGLLPFEVQLFRRTDYDEERGETEWYGIEMDKAQYKAVKKALK